MANAITEITIVHDSAVNAASMSEQLIESSSAHVREQLIKLRDYFDSLINGSATAQLTVGMDSGGSTDKATGTITFTNMGVADETVTIGSVVLTWKASAANENQVTIGADQAASQTNLAAAINAHSKLAGLVDATSTGSTVVVTATRPGRWGNLIALAEAGTNTSVSGASLAGGDGAEVAAPITITTGGI